LVKAVSPLFNKLQKGLKNLDIRLRKNLVIELALKRVPFNPRTEAQQAIRQQYGKLVGEWRALTPEEKASYEAEGEKLKISGWNYFLMVNWLVEVVGWQLIEEKEAPTGSTELVFTGLNGDEDKQYMLIGDGYMTLDGVDRHIYLAPNGVETGQHNMELNTWWNGVEEGVDPSRNYPDSRISLARNGWGLDGDYFFRALIHAKTGLRRHIISFTHFWRTDREFAGTRFSIWDDIVTNITSLAIRISGGSFSGKFRLFKMVEA